MPTTPDLIASYFTLAGDIFPFGPTEISPFSFESRVEAAAKAGWRGVGLVLDDIKATAARIGLREMRRILDANGMRWIELEFLADWFRDDDRRPASDRFRREILDMAEALGARDVKIAPGLGRDIAHPTPAELVPDIDRMTAAFATICREAAERGTSIVMEIMPFGDVSTIANARRIVEAADQPNGGLLLDIWHLARGGQDVAEIRDIPARFIGAAELDDAPARQVGATLWDDTIHHRLLPGEGDLDQQAFIEAIRSTGFDKAWSVEILSATFRKRPLRELAETAFRASVAQFT